MHELSIALSIIEGVEEELAGRDEELVEAVHLRLGPLSGVVREALMFSFGVASAGTRLEGSRLEIEDVPIIVYCPSCRDERPAVSAQNLSCAACGAPAGEVRRGAELQVFAIELARLEIVNEQRAAAG